MNAQEIYTCVVKREWKKVRCLPWKAVSLDVELDLAEDDKKTPQWQAVRLLFVPGLKEPADTDAGKKEWALFLTTNVHLSMSKMLEVYAYTGATGYAEFRRASMANIPFNDIGSTS